MKYISLIVAILLSLISQAQSENDKIKLFENDLFHWDTTKNKKGSLQERMAHYEVHAVSIAVIHDFKLAWVKAYGYADVAENIRATTQTLFQAASISKTINSLGILKLVEEGKLQLDIDINNYLSTWKFPYDTIAKAKKITIGNLLNHQAGLSIHGFKGYEKGETLPTTIQTLDGLKPSNSNAVRSELEPGLKFQYSGGGTTITQLILENTTKEKYEHYMKKNILTPLGMKNSFFTQPPPKEMEKLLATAYVNGQEVKKKYHVYPEKAAAGLWTNPTDLAKYIIETQLSVLGKSNKILSKEMSIKRIDNKFGVFFQDYDGVKYFGHSGGNEGFMCHYVGSMEGGNGIIVMTNGSNFNLIEEIFCSIASLNHWKNYPLELSKESAFDAIKKTLYQNVDKGIEMFYDLKKNNPKEYNFYIEEELNLMGYEFMNNQKLESAIKIFNLNVIEFPSSSNAFDSRGEVYFKMKDYEKSKAYYLKSLELNAKNENARMMIIQIDELLKIK